MAITYPLSLPSAGIRRVKMMTRAVVAVSESPFTLQQQVQQFSGQAWGASISLPPMLRATAEQWIAFLLKLNGKQGTFLLGDPAGVTARGVATGTPLVKGANQTGNSLATDGWTPNTANILRAGDYFQLGSGATARLYKVLNDVAADAGGNATLDIWPSLRSSPADNDPIVVSNAVGLFRLTTNETDWDIDEAKIYGLQFAAMESL